MAMISSKGTLGKRMCFAGLAGVFLPMALWASGPDLIYQPGDLEMKASVATGVPSEADVNAEVSDFIDRNASIFSLFKIKIKKDQKLIQKLIELDKQFHFINLKSLRKFEKRLNVQAWTGLWSGIQNIKIKKFDAATLASLQNAVKDYQALRDMAKKDRDPAKVGKYAFMAGKAREVLARQEPDRLNRKTLLRTVRDDYQEAYQSLSLAPDASQAVSADDALEKVFSLDQDFGGIVPMHSSSGQAPVITSDMGMRIHPKTKKRTFHKGLDLANAGCNGWNVRSIGPGRVIKSGWERGYGYVVNLVHEVDGEKMYTRYAHLKKAGRVSAGTVVAKETPLGQCNNSGVSTGPHLHFEILTGGEFGTPVDPKMYLPRLQVSSK